MADRASREESTPGLTVMEDVLHTDDQGTLTVQRGVVKSGQYIQDPKSELHMTDNNATL